LPVSDFIFAFFENAVVIEIQRPIRLKLRGNRSFLNLDYNSLVFNNAKRINLDKSMDF